MFPLEFPMRVLSRDRQASSKVFDPFCGRGTTNLAARIRGMSTVGVDSHPLAKALTEAKLTSIHPDGIVSELIDILNSSIYSEDLPIGEFWDLAFETTTLVGIVKVREALLRDCKSPARLALRAIILGALHGPISRTTPSYLSNQCPRTFAPKPRYAISYWREHDLRPPQVDLVDLVSRRARRYYSERLPSVYSKVIFGDSRDERHFERELNNYEFDWIITSPPYYGMRTYRPDQWLRLWFLGGSESVDYSQKNQLTHESPGAFVNQLSRVWENCARVCRRGARMVIRFGQISDRKVDPYILLRDSLSDTNWRIQTRCDAGSASQGKRQADHFGITSRAQTEFDLWVVNS